MQFNTHTQKLCCRRDVGNGEDLGAKREKHRQESVGSVAADPDSLENIKEAGREAQEIVCPLCRVGFRNKYH